MPSLPAVNEYQTLCTPRSDVQSLTGSGESHEPPGHSLNAVHAAPSFAPPLQSDAAVVAFVVSTVSLKGSAPTTVAAVHSSFAGCACAVRAPTSRIVTRTAAAKRGESDIRV